MWNNKLYIDGIDAFLEWGAFVADGGYKQLIQFPSFKKLTYTEWEEYNGAEYDLSAPVLDSMNVQIDFVFTNIKYAEDMYYYLTQSAYHTFQFVDLGLTRNLRLTSGGSVNNVKKLGKLSLTFSFDFPTVPNASPQTIEALPNTGYTIDGTDIGEYGAYVLAGTDKEFMKLGSVRQAVKISAADASGVSYDSAAPVRMKTFDVTLKLLIKTDSVTEFWKRYNTLFHDVLSSGSRELHFSRWNNTYGSFYKSMSINKFNILSGGRVWCEFSLVMTIYDFTLSENWFILAAENGNTILTEDGTYNIKIRKK